MHGAPNVTRNDRHARRQGSNVSRRARPWDQLIEVAREIEFTRLIRGVRAHALSLSNTLTPHSVSVWHRFHELAFSTDVSSVAVQPQQRNEFFRRRLVHIKSQSLSSLSRPTCFPLTTILREAFPGLPLCQRDRCSVCSSNIREVLLEPYPPTMVPAIEIVVRKPQEQWPHNDTRYSIHESLAVPRYTEK